MSRLLRKRKKKGRLSILSHREFYAWKGRMKSRDESIFDSFRFPLRGILSEGKASPSDLISTRHDCARYCRYINLKDDQGGHESRSSLDRPTLCPEDVERLVSSGVSIEEYRFQGKMWPVDIFSSHYRSTRSNYRETACKRGERKSLFAFTDESAFENAIDRSF